MTWLAPARQWALLIALSAAVAALLLGLHAPAALMLGPLGSAMLLASGGLRVRFPLPLFVVSQGVIGCLIAKMVPLTIVGDILQHWLLFTAGVLFVVAASSLLGWLMTRLEILPGTTALWGTSAGAASIMTIMAESYGADIRLVAVMQYLRVVLVAGVAALVARLFGVSTVQAAAPLVWFPHVHWLPFLETMALAIAGPLLARSLRIPAGAFLVPMIAGIVLTHFGLMTIELPTWLLAGCYALVGWIIGLRFTRDIVLYALRVLPRVTAAILTLMLLCGALGWVLHLVLGIDPLTAYLATSPGGADSIAIIAAASSKVDLPFVMAMQSARFLLVLLAGPALARMVARWTQG